MPQKFISRFPTFILSSLRVCQLDRLHTPSHFQFFRVQPSHYHHGRVHESPPPSAPPPPRPYHEHLGTAGQGGQSEAPLPPCPIFCYTRSIKQDDFTKLCTPSAIFLVPSAASLCSILPPCLLIAHGAEQQCPFELRPCSNTENKNKRQSGINLRRCSKDIHSALCTLFLRRNSKRYPFCAVYSFSYTKTKPGVTLKSHARIHQRNVRSRQKPGFVVCAAARRDFG